MDVHARDATSAPGVRKSWVRLFQGTLDGSNSDHLTSFKCGRKGRSGLAKEPQRRRPAPDAMTPWVW
jgi:hypothetical protein